MTSQRISELLIRVTKEDRDDFYQSWCALRSEVEYLALDITSASSYSELIESAEWGYNRDKEKLPQINICLLMGYQSGYPIYQSAYSGSLKDVTTLQSTMRGFKAIAGEKPMVAVMDKGFFSTKNANAMLSPKHHADFIIAVPFTSKFALGLVESESRDNRYFEQHNCPWRGFLAGGDETAPMEQWPQSLCACVFQRQKSEWHAGRFIRPRSFAEGASHRAAGEVCGEHRVRKVSDYTALRKRKEWIYRKSPR
jgi:hypothetical protein